MNFKFHIRKVNKYQEKIMLEIPETEKFISGLGKHPPARMKVQVEKMTGMIS